MTVNYDKYYQTPKLFGEPYPELVEFMSNFTEKGKVLDLGCGQGRDAIALARLSYSVRGIDHSRVAIDQMNAIGKIENLDFFGQVEYIYSFDRFEEFDIVLLDSMFHFAKKDKEKEVGLIKRIVCQIKKGCIVVICIQDTGDKVQILNGVIDDTGKLIRQTESAFKYIFEDKENGHKSETNYKMIVVEK